MFADDVTTKIRCNRKTKTNTNKSIFSHSILLTAVESPWRPTVSGRVRWCRPTRAAVDTVGRQCWPRALKTPKPSFVECVQLVTLDEGAFDLTEIKLVASTARY